MKTTTVVLFVIMLFLLFEKTESSESGESSESILSLNSLNSPLVIPPIPCSLAKLHLWCRKASQARSF